MEKTLKIKIIISYYNIFIIEFTTTKYKKSMKIKFLKEASKTKDLLLIIIIA